MNSASATIQDFVIVDVETTGLSSSRDSIIEVAALKVEHLKITAEFSSLVRPSVRIPFKISKLTGITQKMVDKYGQSERDVINRLLIFVGDLPLAGHNVSFDYEFLCRSCKRWGFPALPAPCLDSLKLARIKLRGLPHDLSHLAVYYEIENTGAHRALADCRMTYEVLMRLLAEPGGVNLEEELPEEGYDEPYLPPKGKQNALGAEFESVMGPSPADVLQPDLEPVSEPSPERERPADYASPRPVGPGRSEPNVNVTPRSVNTGRSRQDDYGFAYPDDGSRDRANGNAVPRSSGTGRSHRDDYAMAQPAGPDGNRGRADAGVGRRDDERIGQPSGLGAPDAEPVAQNDRQPQRDFIPVPVEKKAPLPEPKPEVKRDLDYYRRTRKPGGGYAPRRDFIPCIGYEAEQQAIPAPEPASERVPDSVPPPRPAPMPNPRSNPRPAPMPDSRPNPMPAPMPDSRPAPMPNPRSNPRPAPMPNSRPAPMPEPRPAPIPAPIPAPGPDQPQQEDRSNRVHDNFGSWWDG